jgi:hypothetical protein
MVYSPHASTRNQKVQWLAAHHAMWDRVLDDVLDPDTQHLYSRSTSQSDVASGLWHLMREARKLAS